MDSALPSFPSLFSHEESCLFHRMDRLLYSILVINQNRDPIESMQVLAFLLWFERVGYRHLIQKITTLPNMLINEIADETISCLKYINTSNFSCFSYSSYYPPSQGCDMSLLQSIAEREISVLLLYENRESALRGVAKILRDVCGKAFGDIMQQAIVRNTIEKMEEAHRQRQISEKNNPQLLQQQQQQQQLWSCSIEHSHIQGTCNVVKGGDDHNETIKEINEEEVPADERTLFLTFSKGYPVTEREVKDFFRMLYGDYVEALYMQEVQTGEQALFARIVFRSATIIDMITSGLRKAKFSINGKHVWARKFVPKLSQTCL
ncbi:hypothetical protein Lalb_Chr13g0299451 [Lupinus albus]|uniref:RRM domain-containing protein n=1 Tax=Lupinus albus TaxID=3870 RepID=A0A6A4PJA2_LUPAL|nr:hypothetical protein Lalb_Chr13g0299451 [Lupinus albus]